MIVLGSLLQGLFLEFQFGLFPAEFQVEVKLLVIADELFQFFFFIPELNELFFQLLLFALQIDQQLVNGLGIFAGSATGDQLAVVGQHVDKGKKDAEAKEQIEHGE